MEHSVSFEIVAEGQNFKLVQSLICTYCNQPLTSPIYWETTKSEWMCEPCYEHPKNYDYKTCLKVESIKALFS